MNLDQFRAKWGGVFGSLLIMELINRIDANVNVPLVAAGKELADDLKSLLAATAIEMQLPPDIVRPNRLTRLRETGDSEKGERS